MKQTEQKIIEFDAVCEKISKGKSGVNFEIESTDCIISFNPFGPKISSGSSLSKSDML